MTNDELTFRKLEFLKNLKVMKYMLDDVYIKKAELGEVEMEKLGKKIDEYGEDGWYVDDEYFVIRTDVIADEKELFEWLNDGLGMSVEFIVKVLDENVGGGFKDFVEEMKTKFGL